jgi:transcriptional regulator with XRE-family HTH domain
VSEYDPFSDDPNGQDEQPESTEDDYERRFEPGSSTLGHAARQRRELLGITQEDVAERFYGPSVASLRTIENGQSGSYRAKTLFSLDNALAWPRGASVTLLSGNIDRIDGSQLEAYQLDTMSRNTFSIELRPMEFDRLVDRLIRALSDEDALKYDVPFHSATITEPRASVDKHVNEEPDISRTGTQTETDTAIDRSNFDSILAAVASLSAGELEEIGHFAINFARLIRQFNKSTGKLSIGGEEMGGVRLRKHLLKIATEMAQDGEEVESG